MNYMVYVRGNARDYDDWAASGCMGWSYEDVLPYFIKSETNQNNFFKKSGDCFIDCFGSRELS